MITFARAAISKIAVYISSARDQMMAQPVPPPVIGCQSGETDHGLPWVVLQRRPPPLYLVYEPGHFWPERGERIVCTGYQLLFLGVQ